MIGEMLEEIAMRLIIDVLESIVEFLNIVKNVILVIFGALLIVYIFLEASI